MVRIFELIFVSFLGITTGYCFATLQICDQVTEPSVFKPFAFTALSQESDSLLAKQTGTLNPSETIPEGGPAAWLSRGSGSSILTIVKIGLDIGWLLVFTLLTAGLVKFLGVVGYSISQGIGRD